ncbi:MAG: hypothetical protein LBD93_01470 [Treponema sp.]|jgi:hypothetical protein|nr:hypothetical protein [Treponema sp.]
MRHPGLFSPMPETQLLSGMVFCIEASNNTDNAVTGWNFVFFPDGLPFIGAYFFEATFFRRYIAFGIFQQKIFQQRKRPHYFSLYTSHRAIFSLTFRIFS